MLVLSRREGQRLVFPGLDVEIEIIKVRGNLVRLGIDAPRNIKVLREELADSTPGISPLVRANQDQNRWTHEFRGKLNSAVMGLYLVEQQIRAGMEKEAEQTLHHSLVVLESLDRSVTEENAVPSAKLPHADRLALLVEDNHNEEVLLANYLRMSGYQVESVHNGLEALDYLENQRTPDFVLMDMNMPQYGGRETISAIRQKPQYHRLKILAVTGCTQEEMGVPQGKQGVDGWFLKPLNPARLVEAMNAMAHHN